MLDLSKKKSYRLDIEHAKQKGFERFYFMGGYQLSINDQQTC